MKKKENEIQELEKLAEVLRTIGLDAKVVKDHDTHQGEVSDNIFCDVRHDDSWWVIWNDNFPHYEITYYKGDECVYDSLIEFNMLQVVKEILDEFNN